MFKPTDRQISLLSPAAMLPDGAERRLRRSWADGFQRDVLPILLRREGDFSCLYDDSTGRPNWSVARLLGLHILQQLHDFTDQQAVDALAFDLRFQHALGLTSDGAYLSRRSHVQFRTRLAAADPDMKLLRGVFEAVGAAAIDGLNISTSSQRIDSTRITSNIQNRGRVDLFTKTIRYFLDDLRAKGSDRLAAVSPELLEWYEQIGDGSFGGMDGSSGSRSSAKQLAKWLLELIEQFADDDAVTDCEPYQLMVRLFAEHCVPVVKEPNSGAGRDDDDNEASAGDGQPSREPAATQPPATPGEPHLRSRPQATDGYMQSPYDPDASYGHKGSGYHVQLTETCGNVATEILTDYAVSGAHVSDHGQAERSLERLAASGQHPTTLFADAGYASGKSIQTAAAQGTELVSPVVGSKLPDDYVGRDRFTFDDVSGDVLSCPEGHAPTRHDLRSTTNAEGPTRHAYFDGNTCRACSLLGRCAVRGPNNGKQGSFHLEILTTLRVRDEALARQRDSEWRRRYRTRSGVEATVAELKGPHGLGRLRVRRLRKVRMLVCLKLTACNVKRWMRVRRRASTLPTSGPTPGPDGPDGLLARLLRPICAMLAASSRQLARDM